MKDSELLVLEMKIEEKIFVIRGKKVMLDFDLAELYEVETRSLKQALRRNITRFPPDFMFVLTQVEWSELITNCDKFKKAKHYPVLPSAFTEQGIAMLSSILNSEKAIQLNIEIMRIFMKMREYLIMHSEFKNKLEEIEKKFGVHDLQIRKIFEAIRELHKPESIPSKKPIGFKID